METKITEQTFIDLGFERTDVPMEESGCDYNFYYYTLNIGDVCLMSSSNDEVLENSWECCIFDSETLNINNITDLTNLVRILKDNTNEK
jgi:hypothetical protein